MYRNDRLGHVNWRLTLLLTVTAVRSSVAADATMESVPDQLRKTVATLDQAPQVFACPEVPIKGEEDPWHDLLLYTPELRAKAAESTVKAIYFEGTPYQGKPTRVFAFLGLPKAAPGAKVPGIVLVHGGGGSAFEVWVRQWNARGYAAIAMDTCGCIPIGTYGNWTRSQCGGPAGWGGMDQLAEPLPDQWTFQAVTAIVRAHSLLRAQPEVDPQRVGIIGISWGGFLTGIVAGLDQRFRFAVPVYGCGFLGETPGWQANIQKMGQENAEKWLRQWDPAGYLPWAKMPILWIRGPGDFANQVDALQKSYGLPPGPRVICIRPDMQHGHGGPGENPEEIRVFADTYCQQGIPLAQITGQGRDGARLWAKYRSDTRIVSATIHYANALHQGQDRTWDSQPAVVEADHVWAKTPEGPGIFYLNLTDERGLTVSSEHETWEARR